MVPPFSTLIADCPGEEAYDPEFFRTEWDPITHQGPLDGGATRLVIADDPAEALEPGELLIPVFVYSLAPGAHGDELWDAAGIAAYRCRWLDALLAAPSRITEVRCLGPLAQLAYQQWQATRAR